MVPARRLAAALEPFVGQVYFAPECHRNYVALGFDPSVRRAREVELPDGPAYFASRGSLLGQVSGHVITAAFAVFSPAVVIPSVELAWSRTDADTIRAARADGAVAQLRRILGDRPIEFERVAALLAVAIEPVRLAGRPLAAGVAALDLPDDPLARAWQLGDLLREYRGDSHNVAWIATGLDAAEIGLLTESYWGLPLRSYSRTRGWTDDELDVATERMRRAGLVDDATLTAEGRALREQIEVATDRQLEPVIEALDDRLAELCDLLEPWGVAIRDAHGYPAAGPHDLAH